MSLSGLMDELSQARTKKKELLEQMDSLIPWGNFGYKAHIGVDKDSGLVHTVKATAANVHDVTMTSELLSGEEEAVYGDSGYLGAEKREDAVVRNKNGKKIRYKAIRSIGAPLSSRMPRDVPRHRSNAGSMRNPPSEQKSNTFLRLSKTDFDTERRDTGGCENRPQN